MDWGNLRISYRDLWRAVSLPGLFLVASWSSYPSPALCQEPPAFHVKLSSQVTDRPVTGRLYVFVSTKTQGSPMRGPSWFGPEPFAAIDVSEMKPDEVQIVDDRADCYPQAISSWPAHTYRVQAVLDHDFYYPAPSVGPGNFHSQVVTWDYTHTNGQPASTLELVLDQTVPEITYMDTPRVKFVQRKSDLLSSWFNREVIDRAAVILPESYDSQPERRYPVYYEITGFGGNLRSVGARGPNRRAQTDVEFIHVLLTGECKNGHHVYANSPANGPRGDVLIHEMIPEIDASFRTIADPDARFVGGHSSGGWASLWLLVNYPESFAAVYSTSPDPVDFRDFQGTDLYAQPPQSVYVDPEGNRRPLARRGTSVALWYDEFCKMDQVLGRGGQMRSFDAAFSPLDHSNQPERCWNVTTGVVRPQIVDYWKQYDISLKIASHWESLRDVLQGKINVVMGELDTFYLDGATRLLAERLKELGSDAKIEMIPEASHNLPPRVFQQLRSAMRDKYLEKFDADGQKRMETPSG